MTPPPLDLAALEAAGLQVTGVVTRLGGSTTALASSLEVGQRVAIVADAVVTDVGLKGPGSEIRLVRVLKANDLYEVGGDAGTRVLGALREARRSYEPNLAHDVLPGIVATIDAEGVLITEAERAALTDTAAPDAALEHALAWARTNFPGAFTFDTEEYLEALDAIAELELWSVRYLDLVERNGDDRDEVLDALSGRADEEVERLAGVEPWDGYGSASVAVITARLDDERLTMPDRIVWHARLDHVLAFEHAGKERRGVLEYVTSHAVIEETDSDDDLSLDDKAGE